MRYDRLREEVCEANRRIGQTGLALLTWGNASGIERESGIVGIKPSGIDYDDLTPGDIVLLQLDSGRTVDGSMRSSSDTLTHLYLYRKFTSLEGIVHTHSHFATVWAQAGREIPCYGTTHADLFRGPVPITRALTREEVGGEYEMNTGKVIVEHFENAGLDVAHNPGVLVRGHGPFAWGASAPAAVDNALAVEEVARMAYHSVSLNPDLGPVPDYLLEKHFRRKHGPDAYYGQP